MKKITIYLMATCCLTLSFLPLQLNATTNIAPSPVVVTKPIDSPEANVLVLRLNEIKEMDKSILNRSEKNELQQEVRAIEKNLHDNYGGVYISVGGLIIIILLLIIIF